MLDLDLDCCLYDLDLDRCLLDLDLDRCLLDLDLDLSVWPRSGPVSAWPGPGPMFVGPTSRSGSVSVWTGSVWLWSGSVLLIFFLLPTFSWKFDWLYRYRCGSRFTQCNKHVWRLRWCWWSRYLKQIWSASFFDCDLFIKDKSSDDINWNYEPKLWIEKAYIS